MDVSSMNRTMPGAYGTDKARKKMTDEKSAFLEAAKGASGSTGQGGGMVMRSVPSTGQGPAQGDGFGYPTASPGASGPTPGTSGPTPAAQYASLMPQERIHGRPVGMPSGERAHFLKHDIGVAIAKGDTQGLEDLLKNPPPGFDINAVNGPSGGTALHEAVSYGKEDIVRFLVDHAGIDMAKLDNSGTSAYQVADAKAKASGDPADRATADYLRGRMTDELKRAALDGNYNRADELVNAGADASILPGGKLASREWFTQPNLNFSYYLRNAITKGDTEAVQTLLKDAPKGWDINAVGTSVAGMGGGDDTLLQSVARSGINGGVSHSNEDTIRALIDNDSIDRAKLDASGKSAYQNLEDRAKALHDPVIQRDADFLRDKMNGELGTAVGNGNLDRAGALIKAGAQPNAEIAPGVTALSWAAATGNPDLIHTIVDTIPPENLEAELNKKGVNGVTALHAAAEAGNRDVYDYLKSKGADDTIKNDAGTAPRDLLNKLQPRSGPGGWKSIPEEGVLFNLANAAAIGFHDLLNRFPSGVAGVDPNTFAGMPAPTPSQGANSPPTSDLSDDTRAFIGNPMAFAGQNFIGDIGAAPGSNFRPENGQNVAFNVAPTTPGNPAPGHPNLGGDAPGAAIQLTQPDPGNVGPNTATWLDFQGGRDTTITVPAHPSGNDPRFVMTPAVTGCAFYATDNHDGTITFHHRSYPGDGNQNQGVPAGSTGIGYEDYGPHRGGGGGGNWAPNAMGNQAGQQGSTAANGLAPFAYYDGNKWIIQGQPFQADSRNGPNTLEPFSPSTGGAGLGGFTKPV